jgi:hypothetical protein
MKRIALILVMLLMIRWSGQTQGLEKPPDGKAVLYFAFDSSIPSEKILLFAGEALIGNFKNGDYARVIVDPGHHVFWAWNTESAWMEADVAAHRVYLVVVEGIRERNGTTIRMTPVKDGTTRFWQLQRMIRRFGPADNAFQLGPDEIYQLKQLGSTSIASFRNGDVKRSGISFLPPDMEVGKVHFEVPPISH